MVNKTKEQLIWDSCKTVRDLANKAHADTNQMYAGIYPYALHLNWVSNTARRFNEYLDETELQEAYCTAALHDSIEDARLTYHDVLNLLLKAGIVGGKTRENIANNVLALTVDIRGRNRKERQNDAYYEDINKTRVRRYAKICDRIANMQYGSIFGGSMLDKYRKELYGEDGFLEKLNVAEFSKMYDFLIGL
jgi:(p)ppGpp synthase/HD superfamily hydrolase